MLAKGKGWGGRWDWSRVEGGGTGGKERQMGTERERNMCCVEGGCKRKEDDEEEKNRDEEGDAK